MKEIKYLICIKSTHETNFKNPDLKGKIHSQNGVIINGLTQKTQWSDIHELF